MTTLNRFFLNPSHFIHGQIAVRKNVSCSWLSYLERRLRHGAALNVPGSSPALNPNFFQYTLYTFFSFTCTVSVRFYILSISSPNRSLSHCHGHNKVKEASHLYKNYSISLFFLMVFTIIIVHLNGGWCVLWQKFNVLL